MDSDFPRGRLVPPLASAGLADAPAEEPAHPDFSRLPSGAELFGRAERERDAGNLEGAARLFGRAAGAWRTAGDVLEAADAYLELGAILLRQGRGRLLPELASRLLVLTEIKPQRRGTRLNLKVYAVLIARGEENQEAFLGLVQERRLFRHRLARAS